MSVAGPFLPRHPAPAWPLAGAADDGDDPALPLRWRVMPTHEADVVAINRRVLEFACEPCKLAFASLDSVKAHQHGNRPNMLVRMLFDARSPYVLVECLTMAQADAAVRAYLQGP